MGDCCGRLAAWPPSRRQPANQLGSAVCAARANTTSFEGVTPLECESETAGARCCSGERRSIEDAMPVRSEATDRKRDTQKHGTRERDAQKRSAPERDTRERDTRSRTRRSEAGCSRTRHPKGTSLPTGRRQHRKSAQQRGHHCQKTPRWGLTAEKSC